MSAASLWKLSFRHRQGKLPELSGAISDLTGLLQADGFEALPISLAQAELDRLVLLTADAVIAATFTAIGLSLINPWSLDDRSI